MSDDIATPTVLDPTGGAVNFTMVGATATAGSGETYPDRWYSLTPTVTGLVSVRFTAITMNYSSYSYVFRLSVYGAALGVEFFHGTWPELDHGQTGVNIRYNYAQIDIRYQTQAQLGSTAKHVVAGQQYLVRLVDRRPPVTSTVSGTFAWSVHEQLPANEPGPTIDTREFLVIRRRRPDWIIPS